MDNNSLVLTDDFKERVRVFNEDFYQKYNDIAKTKTPKVDGNGREVIKTRPDGKDYIEEAWMRDRLDKHFPGWSSTMAAPLHFLGAEWVVAQVDLAVIDEHLLAYNINPPIRHFYGVDAVRIQYKKDMPHTPENIVDVGDNCQSAVSGAFKRCINRLTHIGDDIYGKRVEEQGAGTYEDVVMETNSLSAFGNWVQRDIKMPWDRVFAILNVKSLIEITNPQEAMEKIKQARGVV